MIEVTDSNFEQEVLNSDIPVVVDFWAPWCASCKSMMPTVERVAGQFGGKVKFVKVNVDDSEIGSTYGVRGIPAFYAFKDGKLAKTLQGSQNATSFTNFVNTIA